MKARMRKFLLSFPSTFTRVSSNGSQGCILQETRKGKAATLKFMRSQGNLLSATLLIYATGINWVHSLLPHLTALCILHSYLSPCLLVFNTIYQHSFLLSCLSPSRVLSTALRELGKIHILPFLFMFLSPLG